jgi:hypothetical protein
MRTLILQELLPVPIAVLSKEALIPNIFYLLDLLGGLTLAAAEAGQPNKQNRLEPQSL